MKAQETTKTRVVHSLGQLSVFHPSKLNRLSNAVRLANTHDTADIPNKLRADDRTWYPWLGKTTDGGRFGLSVKGDIPAPATKASKGIISGGEKTSALAASRRLSGWSLDHDFLTVCAAGTEAENCQEGRRRGDET